MMRIIKYLFSTRSLPIIICTSLMLLFLGLYFLIAFKSNDFVDSLKNETNVLVELNQEIGNDQIPTIRETLRNLKGVLESSIEYLSKEDALSMMEGELGISFSELDSENPFYDVFQFNVSNEALESKSWLEEIKNIEGVNNAYLENSYSDEIGKNVRRFSRLALIAGIFFSGLAIILIFNAIKLSLVESKSSFYTLKLLGSDWDFIKKPFLQRAFYTGLLAGIIAIVLLLLILSYLTFNNQVISKIVNFGNVFIVVLIMLLVGFIVNIVSTNIILNKYLSMKEEDLYN